MVSDHARKVSVRMWSKYHVQQRESVVYLKPEESRRLACPRKVNCAYVIAAWPLILREVLESLTNNLVDGPVQSLAYFWAVCNAFTSSTPLRSRLRTHCTKSLVVAQLWSLWRHLVSWEIEIDDRGKVEEWGVLQMERDDTHISIKGYREASDNKLSIMWPPIANRSSQSWERKFGQSHHQTNYRRVPVTTLYG